MIEPRIRAARTRPPRANATFAAASAALGVALTTAAGSATAGPFEPEIDLFGIGADARLAIDRGGPVHDAGDVDGDGSADIILGAGPNSSVRVIFGTQSGVDGRFPVSILDGDNGFTIAARGMSVGGGGDLNGDGLDDVVVGGVGESWVVYGRTERFPASFNVATLDGTNGFVFEATGDTVAIVPDTDGDGLDDLLVGSEGADSAGFRDAGRVALVRGRRGTGPARLGPWNLDGENGTVFYGESTLNLLGWSAESAGDLNADGLGDIVIGAPGTTVNGAVEAGRAYIVYGAAGRGPLLDLATLGGADGFVFQGVDPEDTVGYSGRAAGDLNGDGVGDLALGAPGKGPFGMPGPYPGEAHVVFGGASLGGAGDVIDRDALDGTSGFTLRGIRGGTATPAEGEIGWGDQAGSSVSAAGDINADGLDDLIVGAPYTIINDARRGNGQVYVIYGRAGGGFPARLPLASLDGESGFRWTGAGTTDYTGFSVSRAGDWNLDGVDDVLVGASGQGESYIFYGRAGAATP